MANNTIKQLTPNSWLADANGNPFAYIHQKGETFEFITNEEVTTFSSMDAIKLHIGGKVREHVTTAVDEQDTEALTAIEGFPVKHANIIVEQAGTKPVYVRGKTQHVAGYWCIKFSKRWVPAYCPMLRTSEQYKSSGPFKSRLEMMNTLASLNRTDS